MSRSPEELQVLVGQYERLFGDIKYQVTAGHLSSGGACVRIRELLDKFEMAQPVCVQWPAPGASEPPEYDRDDPITGVPVPAGVEGIPVSQQEAGR